MAIKKRCAKVSHVSLPSNFPIFPNLPTNFSSYSLLLSVALSIVRSFILLRWRWSSGILRVSSHSRFPLFKISSPQNFSFDRRIYRSTSTITNIQYPELFVQFVFSLLVPCYSLASFSIKKYQVRGFYWIFYRHGNKEVSRSVNLFLGRKRDTSSPDKGLQIMHLHKREEGRVPIILEVTILRL